MKDINSNMDKVFRDRLEDFQQQPPEEIWSGIKAGMAAKPRRKILIPLWQAAAGAALLITAGSLFYFINRSAQGNLADQILPLPQNIQYPAQQKTNDSKEILTIATEVDIQNEINGSSPVQTNGDNSSILDLSQKSVEKSGISAANQEKILTAINTKTEISGGVSMELMSEGYLRPLPQDKIPRNKKTFRASWDMLQAGTALISIDDGNKERLFLTAQVSPTYSYRDIGSVGANGSDQFSQYESGKISYSGGMQFGYQTTERLSIHTGLMYAQLGYNISGSFNSNAIATGVQALPAPEKANTVYAVRNSIGSIISASDKNFTIESNGGQNYYSDFNTNVTTVVPPVITQSGKIEQYFQYLEVPFLLRYRIIDRKMGVNLVSGVSTNILVGNHASITIDNETSKMGASENVRSFNYLGNIGLGFDYSLRKNLLFTIEPQFKYFLNSINQNSLVNRPYMLGMFTGVRYMW